MKDLANIQGQQFYSASISELLSYCSENNCAIVIDEVNLKELIKTGLDNLKDKASQIIIISDCVNAAVPPLIGINVFIIAADDISQAVELARQSSILNDKVVCVVQDETQIQQILNSIEG